MKFGIGSIAEEKQVQEDGNGENIARQLEEAWRAGEETVVVHNEWGGQDEYNVRTMLGKNVPIGMGKSVTRPIHRVLYEDDM